MLCLVIRLSSILKRLFYNFSFVFSPISSVTHPDKLCLHLVICTFHPQSSDLLLSRLLLAKPFQSWGEGHSFTYSHNVVMYYALVSEPLYYIIFFMSYLRLITDLCTLLQLGQWTSDVCSHLQHSFRMLLDHKYIVHLYI